MAATTVRLAGARTQGDGAGGSAQRACERSSDRPRGAEPPAPEQLRFTLLKRLLVFPADRVPAVGAPVLHQVVVNTDRLAPEQDVVQLVDEVGLQRNAF